MIKSKKNIFFFILIIFSVYCSISIGFSWDELTLSEQGKITTNYLLSLGTIDPKDIFRREFYSPIYYSLKYLITQIFPTKYHIEAGHLVNLFFSMAAIVGLKKLCENLFNKKTGIIAFLILFFYPAFFGHMGFNSKDTIIAFCHIWIFLFTIKYIQTNEGRYLNLIGILAATGTGINLFFLGSLIPLFIFFIIEFFFIKKLSKKRHSIKKVFLDFLKCFLLFYLVLVLFWIDTHENILILPFKLFFEWAFSDLWRGYPYILLNGEYYFYSEIPKSYLIINILLKSPEYFLITYLIFIFAIFKSTDFFKSQFKLFLYKFIVIASMVIYPFLLLYFTPFSIYDGLRHVLWMIPYLCIIPALVIFYIIENLKLKKIQVLFGTLSVLIIYFIYNFITITPYQYTYLNILSGKKINHYNKFENDYWGGSIKELIKKINLPKDQEFNFAICGISKAVPKYYLKKFGYNNFLIGNENNSKYVMMTNRSTFDQKENKLTNCFNKFKGEDVFKVSRNGVDLSIIRKIN